MASNTTNKTYKKYELYHYEIGDIKDPSTTTITPLYETNRIEECPIYTNGGYYHIGDPVVIPLNSVCVVKYRPMEYNGNIDIGTNPINGQTYNGWRFFNAATYGLLFDFGSRITAPKLNYGTTYTIEFGNFYIKNAETGTIMASGSKRTVLPDKNYFMVGTNNINMGFYEAKVCNGSEVLYDLVGGCKRGTYGIYDKVRDEFYTPIGNASSRLL